VEQHASTLLLLNWQPRTGN